MRIVSRVVVLCLCGAWLVAGCAAFSGPGPGNWTGATRQQLLMELGEPDEIRNRPDGRVEYHYAGETTLRFEDHLRYDPSPRVHCTTSSVFGDVDCTEDPTPRTLPSEPTSIQSIGTPLSDPAVFVLDAAGYVIEWREK